MLTDDDLTRELGAAFRTETRHLAYTGRRRPRRTAVAAVPLAAVGIALAAITVNLSLQHDPAPATPPVAVETPSAPASPAATPKLVTDTIELAGFTLRYQRAAGETAPLYAVVVRGGLPDGVTPVPVSGTAAKAWIGKDPASGDNALYVKAPTRNDGRLFALMSSQWSQDELVELFTSGTPRKVPLVER